MGALLYSNGITEDYRPAKLVFTEEELVKLFTEFAGIKTVRIPNLINTWCIFGEGNSDPTEYNRIVSDIVRESVFSHALFIHDSEINPNWNATDNILYKSYDEFIVMMKKVIDDVAGNIMNEFSHSEEYTSKADHLPQLVTLGATDDKRILFTYNPDDQTKEFYTHDEFYKFCQRTYNYINENKQEKEPFTIYADKKAVIIIETLKVNLFLQTILNKFQTKEDYEICTNINKIIKDWAKAIKKPRLKKTDSTGEQPNEQTNEQTNEQ
jgi:hypothetical protein